MKIFSHCAWYILHFFFISVYGPSVMPTFAVETVVFMPFTYFIALYSGWNNFCLHLVLPNSNYDSYHFKSIYKHFSIFFTSCITLLLFQYNIPIDIFLPLRYPAEAPKIFVRPTASMCKIASVMNQIFMILWFLFILLLYLFISFLLFFMIPSFYSYDFPLLQSWLSWSNHSSFFLFSIMNPFPLLQICSSPKPY